VLSVLVVLILVMLVGITGAKTFSPGQWRSQFKVGLGLDLSSGTEVVLQAYSPNGKQPSASDMQQAVSILQSRVNGSGTSGATVATQGTNQITVSVPGKAEQQVINLVSSTARLAFRPVLLFSPYTGSAGASSAATPSPTPTGTGTASPAAKSTGTASPKASASASPSSTTTAKTSALIIKHGSGASASSTPAASASATAKATASPSPSASSPASASGPFGGPSQVNAATMKLFDKLVCKPGPNANTVNDSWKTTVGYNDQQSQWDQPKDQTVSCDASGNKYVLGPTVVEGTQVTSATAGLESNSTGWIVNIALDSAASKAFGTLTTNQFDKYYPSATSNEDDAVLDQTAVVLGGDIVSAPETQGALTSGSFQINGGSSGFSEAEATSLANVVKYGQLPLNFTRLSANYVSPTLGHNSLTAGLLAGILGLIVVLVYLLFYYRGLGLFVAIPSLIIAGLLSYFGVVLLSAYGGFTMSLAAIAGLIVAIGITADSFIVFFERLRDEVRDGKQLRPAVESGWKRARRTILVSDTVQFVAALLLYEFATSDVQGFAFTLGLTTIIDIVVVFLFTKPMVTLLASRKFFSSGHSLSGLDPKRLGARAPWRSGVRTVRTQRRSARTGTAASANTSATTPREA
jgi:preprotein translocase subunit SecD